VPGMKVYAMKNKWTVVFGVIFALLVFAVWAKGTGDGTYEGIVEKRFEVSAFYPNNSCSKSPYWFKTDRNADVLWRQWEELGRPEAFHIKFVGSRSRIGMWGHLGKYRREIQAHNLIEVSAAEPCNATKSTPQF
jgi:hypothetical protein